VIHKRQSVIHGHIASRHVVHLFDTKKSLAQSVSGFVGEGLSSGSTVLVVARTRHWKMTARRLKRLGFDVNMALHQGRLHVSRADKLMSEFMRNGLPVEHLFEASVGQLIGRLAGGRDLRVYGEMVDLLAEERNFAGALQLEQLWNDLGTRQSFTLLCGYAAAHFSDPEAAGQLAAICGQHSEVSTGSDDTLGSWVVAGVREAAT
jgi:DcmR-like sensory protein